MAILTAVSLLGYVAELLSWAHQLSVGTEDISRAPDSVWSHSVSSQSLDSSGALFLVPALPPHILPLSTHTPFYFLPSFCSVSFLVSLVVHILFCLSLIISTFSAFCPFSGHPWFLISCVLTTSPHFPSSDPSGPETPSSSTHCPLPPPEVLTPQHTALCAAVYTLGLWRGLIAKVCLSPGGAIVVYAFAHGGG